MARKPEQVKYQRKRDWSLTNVLGTAAQTVADVAYVGAAAITGTPMLLLPGIIAKLGGGAINIGKRIYNTIKGNEYGGLGNILRSTVATCVPGGALVDHLYGNKVPVGGLEKVTDKYRVGDEIKSKTIAAYRKGKDVIGKYKRPPRYTAQYGKP